MLLLFIPLIDKIIRQQLYGEIGEVVNSPGCEPGIHRFDPGISPQTCNMKGLSENSIKIE